MKKSQKTCKHNWKHKVIEGKSMAGTNALWLQHYCSKCKLETEQAEKIEDSDEKTK